MWLATTIICLSILKPHLLSKHRVPPQIKHQRYSILVLWSLAGDHPARGWILIIYRRVLEVFKPPPQRERARGGRKSIFWKEELHSRTL